jgi:hypothetical protein
VQQVEFGLGRETVDGGKGKNAEVVGEAGVGFAVYLVQCAFDYVVADAVAESGDNLKIVSE